MNRVLYQFPLSHYCEKARWLLDFKDLEYSVKNLFPATHRVVTLWKANSTTVPLVKDGKEWIGDSTELAFYLDAKYILRPLLSSNPNLRRQAIILEDLADKAGIHVRRWAYSQALASEQITDLLFNDYPLVKPFKKQLAPLVKRGIGQAYQVNPEKGAISLQKMLKTMDDIEEKLIANGGRYLVGDCLSLADISVASLFVPLLALKNTPWETLTPQNELMEQVYQQTLDRPLGQWIMRLYQEERQPRGNWRG